MLLKKNIRWFFNVIIICIFLLVGKTIIDFKSPYPDFRSANLNNNHLQILDRTGKPLSVSYQNSWNNDDNIALYEIPELLTKAFIASEDKRFFQHLGVDWTARISALWQRLAHKKYSRGASTITEQVVRMLHPRERSYWSKWMEGIEAMALESQTSKANILEFYLNQVPYASNRRGVVQAAKFYFNRDLTTLNSKEILSLAVLVRAPSKFDFYNGEVAIDDSINRLAKSLNEVGALDDSTLANIKTHPIELSSAQAPIEAVNFINYVRAHSINIPNIQKKIITSLDGDLQQFISELLINRLKSLETKHVNHVAALVIDHRTNEILAWVSTGIDCQKNKNQTNGCQIDMATVPRQPGSALKPFLYAAALEKGWNAATIIDDSPYANTIGAGIHHFHNYSNSYYGKVTLRTALGNSLNIPALHTINYVQPQKYLSILQNLGFNSLSKSAAFYDEGLALGNGEVTLFELVQAYSALANHGIFTPLRFNFYNDNKSPAKQVYSPEVASLIGNILSDPWARNLEFGRTSVLNFPTQTAVKTGTSTDYRDAWAVGYNQQYVVGVWMGNTDYSPMDGITGSLGPALALRGIFNQLTQYTETKPLYISPKLIAKDICNNPADIEQQKTNCSLQTEYFLPQTDKQNIKTTPKTKIEIIRPANGLEMAIDPRIPKEKQAFEMQIIGVSKEDEVEWIIDGQHQYMRGEKYLWSTEKGKHQVGAIVWHNGKILTRTKENVFNVK